MAQVQKSTAGRMMSLDAVRGVAALLVVFSHCYSTLPDTLQQRLDWDHTPARILVLGRPTVILFFVLSGFVLSLSLEANSVGAYRTFIVRRFFRIYIPFTISIIMAAVLYRIIAPKPIPSLSEWFNRDVWSSGLTPSLVVSHLAMVGRPQDVTLNGPMWSLIIEMRHSLLFPFLFALLWTRRAVMIATAIAATVVTEIIARKTSLGTEPYFNKTITEALLLTLYFLPFFVLGLLLAQWRDQLCRRAASISPLRQGALWVAAVALLSLRRDLVNGVGAALVVILSISSPVVIKILATPLLQWIGRLSYSLYLMHVIILGALVHMFYDTVPLGWLLLAVVIVSLLVAQVSYSLVERPSIALGKRFTKSQGGAKSPEFEALRARSQPRSTID
jgi:peptidoglycan/LPS O-acetylase OafA/YrhL